MSYEKPTTDNEALSADERKIREMCLSLKKMDAPPDFDFKLRARLADAEPVARRPRFGFAFRYALPALGLILALGLLAYTGGFLSSNNNAMVAGGSDAPPTAAVTPAAAVTDPATPQKSEPPNDTIAVLPAPQISPKVRAIEIAGGKLNEKKRVFRDEDRNPGGGSKDLSLTSVSPKQPNFNAPIEIPKNPRNNERANALSVKEAFSILGISAAFENGKWTVNSVTANGVGANSGIREKDIVEAIDDQPLAGETISLKNASVKTVTVTRDGARTQITLRSKQ